MSIVILFIELKFTKIGKHLSSYDSDCFSIRLISAGQNLMRYGRRRCL